MTVEINHDMDVKELLRENLELTREIHTMTKKIRNHITFQKVVSAIYFVVIIGPIILGFIFLPPLLKNVIGQYQALIGPGATSGIFSNLLNNTQNGSNTPSIGTDTLQKMFQKK